MRLAIVFMLLISGAFGQSTRPKQDSTRDGLSVELRTSSNRVRLTDEIVVSVFFRSPRQQTTIWNALGWGNSTGLVLQVLDSSGRKEKKRYVQAYDVLPPAETGENALISIGGDTFAGFDSHIPVKTLFQEPGSYAIKCLYSAPLSRDYFHGSKIWGKEDGSIESASVTIFVDK